MFEDIAHPLPLTFEPVTNERWQDIQLLFGPRGACGGCWCMYWRQTRSVYEKLKGELNRLEMQTVIASGTIPGLLAYAQHSIGSPQRYPVGWVSIAPRSHFPTLARSRVLKPVDDEPVWSIVCFFILKKFRRMGVTSQLIHAAVDYAEKRGAKIIEAYPIEAREGKSFPDVFAYTGLPGPFLKAGFVEVMRRSETRPILRCYLGGAP